MSALTLASDAVLIWSINVLLQITLVAAIAISLSACFHRSPALRYWVLCSGLLITLLCPLGVWCMQTFEVGLVTISLQSAFDSPASQLANLGKQSSSEPTDFDEGFSSGLDLQSQVNSPMVRAADYGTVMDPEFQEDRANTQLGSTREFTGAPTDSETLRYETVGKLENRSDTESELEATTGTWRAMPDAIRLLLPPILWLWACVTLVLLCRLAIAWMRVRSILRSANYCDCQDLQQALRHAADTLSLQPATAELRISNCIEGPIAAGLMRPKIILPPELVEQVTREQLHEILVHELAHIVRRDQIVVLLQNLAGALFWLHPLTRRLNQRLAQAREEVCDNYVLAASDAPTYSRTLLAIAELTGNARPLPGTVGLFTSRWKLEQRVSGLLDARRNRMTNLTPRGVLLVSLVSLALVALTGLGTMTLAVADATGTAGTEQADNTIEQKAASEIPQTIRVQGVVLRPDGSPASGARVRAATPLWWSMKELLGEDYEPPVFEAQADDAGRFGVEFSTQPFGDVSSLDPHWQKLWLKTSIAAIQPGFGPGWVSYEDVAENADNVTLQLVEDHPIRGIVRDLEGRPTAGVHVKVDKVAGMRTGATNHISDWLAAVQNGELPWTVAQHLPREIDTELVGIPSEFVTDNSGQFEIRGVGAERVLSLEFESEVVANETVTVVTRDIKPTTLSIDSDPSAREKVFGSSFDFTAAPARILEGVVIDAETKEPLPHVTIQSYKLANHYFGNVQNLRTQTDESGRFHLIGMPKGEGNVLMIRPNDEQPYLMRRFEVPNPTGLGPVEVTVEVHRGVWITGSVVDHLTGEPVPGVRFHYLPYLTNEFAQTLPEFNDAGNVDSDQTRYRSDSNGQFRLVGLPGPAIVGAESVLKSYTRGVGWEALKGPKHASGRHALTYRNPVNPGPKWPDAMQEIDPASGTDEVRLDFELDSGRSVNIRVVDQAGELVRGAQLRGLLDTNSSAVTTEAMPYTVVNLGPKESRVLTIHHAERNIGLVARINPEDFNTDETELRMLPCAKVSATLTKDGEPLPGLAIQPRIQPVGDFRPILANNFTTDADGYFEGVLLPGCRYNLGAEGAEIGFGALVFRDLAVEPGTTIQLGNLELGANSEFVSTSDAPPDDGKKVGNPPTKVNLSGRVLNPDGNPIQAQLWLWKTSKEQPQWGPRWTADWQELGQSNPNGTFSIDLTGDPQPSNSDSGLPNNLRLAATKTGYGFVWQDITLDDDQANIHLQLVEDSPIEGRIIDLDGQPVSSVEIQIVEVTAPTQELDPRRILEGAAMSSGVYTNYLMWSGGSPLTPKISTDSDGRFQITGQGRNRWVRLEARSARRGAEDIGATRLNIVTLQAPTGTINGLIRAREGLAESTYFTRFTHVGMPARTVRGVVSDADTGDAIAGVQISADTSWVSRESPSVSAADGSYEITGIPETSEFTLEVTPQDSTYFRDRIVLKDVAGSTSVEVDVQLHRGIIIKGRVVDGETGEPVSGTLTYNALYPNDHIARFDRQYLANPLAQSSIQDDGSYRIAVLPGPGVISVQVPGDHYAPAQVDGARLKEIMAGKKLEARPNELGEYTHLRTAAGGQSRGIQGVAQYQHLELINPTEADNELHVNFQLTPSRSRPGSIVDPAGKPLAGVEVIGIGPSSSSATKEPLETSEFAVKGLVPGHSRFLLFLQRERGLGGHMKVTGDDNAPIEIQLEPTGEITGRLVDKLGEPLRAAYISLMPDQPSVSTVWWVTSVREDDQGNFKISGLIPGCKYLMHAQIPEERLGLFVKGDIVVESGQSLDLGAFTQETQYRFMRYEGE